jgi:hypothetical protein
MSKAIVRYVGNDPKMAGMEGEIVTGLAFGVNQFSLHSVQWKHSFGETSEQEWKLRKLPRGYSKAFR